MEYLGRDATDVEACTTESTALLDASGLETQLSGLYGRHVAAGTTADHDDIVIVRSRRGGGETPGGG